MDMIPISIQGFEDLKRELEALKEERQVFVDSLMASRENGDMSENTAYDAAREQQAVLEARINHIETRMPRLNVIDHTTLRGSKALFGATVTVEDIDGESRAYTLLGPDEADFNKGSISVLSPVAKALLGKEVGDEVVVIAPKGRIEYEITGIEFHA